MNKLVSKKFGVGLSFLLYFVLGNVRLILFRLSPDLIVYCRDILLTFFLQDLLLDFNF